MSDLHGYGIQGSGIQGSGIRLDAGQPDAATGAEVRR